MAENPLAADLNHVLDHTRDLWEDLRGERIFITGGTGFFGCWLLESFAWANDRLGLNASAVVLTRRPEAFRKKAPHLASHPSIQFHIGDVCNFEFPAGSFSYLIQAATGSNGKLNSKETLIMFDTIVEGTRQTLEFARQCGARKILFTSSGAVYGRQPYEITHIPEDYLGGPNLDNPGSAFGEGKRAAETLCSLYSQQYGFEAKIARGFAFVGPYLPLDIHFAIGNFIRDGLNGGPIVVRGDGTPYRSYLYAADLAIWLWTILIKGKSSQPYNVGAARSVTIAQLARIIQRVINPKCEISIAENPDPKSRPQRYVPSVERAKKELGLESWIPLELAIEKTAAWVKKNKPEHDRMSP